MNNLRNYVSGSTPQNEQAKDNQVKNNAGGFVFKISKWERLIRFLILGTEGNTAYQKGAKLTRENAKNIEACLKEDYTKTIDLIVDVSTKGRAPKNDQAIFALAVAASSDDYACRSYALSHLTDVCRIGTHLHHFVGFVKEMRGFSRGLRTALAKWYLCKTPEQLSMQLAKYKSRDKWSHRDILRLSHAKAQDEITNNLFKYATDKKVKPDDLVGLAKTDLLLRGKTDVKEVIDIIKSNPVQREIIPTEFLKEREIWEVLYPSLGYDALLRNLNKMTIAGILGAGNFHDTNAIVDILSNEEKIKKSRIHPISILNSACAYFSGSGDKGSLTWTPNNKLKKPLDEAFYKAFGNIRPTGKNFYLGVDISGSMGCGTIAGTSISPRQAAAAMAMVTMRTERNWIIKGFSHELDDLPIDATMTIDKVIKVMDRLPFGATDCALPMLDAIVNGYDIDCFIIYTDNETWFGGIHPFEALKRYRKQTGKNAKLIVVGMTATEFSIADSDDAGMLDVVGFDTATPQVISEFVGFE